MESIGRSLAITLALLLVSSICVGAETLSKEQASHLLRRTTFRYTARDVARLQKQGPEAFLLEQFESPQRESELENLLRMLPHHGKSPREIYQSLLEDSRATSIIEQEMQRARLLRALETRYQLREVMTDFWFNHFNADPGKGAPVACNVEILEQDLRENAFSNFRDILGLAVRNPAVLENLDNSISKGWAVNENFGRELMELYTTGPVHTQKEVVELARAFSGWAYNNNPDSPDYLRFRYFPEIHASGPKVILGKTFADHEQDLILDHLASHPSTAQFICSKLVRRFVSDKPPAELVEKAAEVFLEQQGEIRPVLQCILTSPEFDSYRGNKLKTPLEFLVSAIHYSSGKKHLPDLLQNNEMAKFFTDQLDIMGSPYSCPNPLGWPDETSTWTSGVGQRSRWAVAQSLGDSELARYLMSPEFQSR